MGINILLVDDHTLVRDAVRSLLECEPDLYVVAATDSGEHAIGLAVERKPDVVVLELELSGVNGIEATRRIRRSCPRCAVVIFSIHTDPRLVDAALAAGAGAYVGKDGDPHDLAVAIRACALSAHQQQTPSKSAPCR